MNVLVIEGPNINMLGLREKSHYGQISMESIHNDMENYARENELSLSFFQSNSEGDIVNEIQNAYSKHDFIVINPAAYTHTSIAIRDALLAVSIPVIEVHLSNIYKREDFRKKSYISDIAVGVISGFKAHGYIMALSYIKNSGREKDA